MEVEKDSLNCVLCNLDYCDYLKEIKPNVCYLCDCCIEEKSRDEIIKLILDKKIKVKKYTLTRRIKKIEKELKKIWDIRSEIWDLEYKIERLRFSNFGHTDIDEGVGELEVELEGLNSVRSQLEYEYKYKLYKRVKK